MVQAVWKNNLKPFVSPVVLKAAWLESATAAYQLVCAWFEYQACLRALEEVGAVARLNAADHGVVGPAVDDCSPQFLRGESSWRMSCQRPAALWLAPPQAGYFDLQCDFE
jgi:hypothetical protein